MKNLHLLPTDKPSVLILRQDCKLFFTGYGGQLGKIHGLRKDVPQNIYITSNEEIKEDVKQWYLDSFLNKPYNSGGAQYSSKQDVIIMTTDQDLIKDGVQAIDDEFLEWFVNNPSCEFVVVKQKQHFEADKSKRINPLNGVYYSYKIIIPKEEPKQETLEEAKKYAELSYYGDEVDAFIAGAKWQAKRMYSELEVDELVYNVIGQYGRHYGIMIDGAKINEWFEQFKKK